MSLLVQLRKAHGGSGADAEHGAQHSQGPRGGECQPLQAVNGRSCMEEALSVLAAPLISVLLTVSYLLSTIISSPCLLLLSLLKPWYRLFIHLGNLIGHILKWERGLSEALSPPCSFRVETIIFLPVPREGLPITLTGSGILSAEPSTFTGSMFL